MLSCNRTGVTRIVFLTRRWAIKVPNVTRWKMLLHGLLANMAERDHWNWSATPGWSGCPRGLLAPVRWCAPGGLVLVMERAERVVTDEEWETTFDTGPFYASSIGDVKPDNIGKFGTSWKWIDYAS